MEDLDAAYDIQRMTLLLVMKNHIANATPGHFNLQLQDLIVTRLQLTQQLLQWPNGQPFDLEQLSRISGSLSHVKARIAELERIVMNDADSADFAKQIHDKGGWNGKACIDRALDDDLRADIVQHLHDVPYRIFQRAGEEVVFE
ncbi:hypothetical protein POM88_035296 [Heracleum sosnowskyi]|uniref:Uncharacterized protein n=1 Tax=Heracleum sosnowskyi TaxID=360622 RepID=A0AAD8HL51_9APIA|nr:hypothetical protein POM88_035296 [Heracleum sosnowskyi]